MQLSVGEMYNGWFQDSRADIDIKRSSRTPLCHFDKLEGQCKKPGDSASSLGTAQISRFKTLLEDST